LDENIKRSKGATIIQALLEYTISILVTGAFLAAILKQVGVSDAVTGIVSSFISLACVAQFFSGLLVRPGRSIRKTVLVMCTVNQLMFASLYLIPFLPFAQRFRVAMFVGAILCAYLISNIAIPVQSKWLMGFVEYGERGRFSARKEIVSLIGGMLFSLSMGAMVDGFALAGREQTGFILCGAAIFLVSVLHLLCMLRISDRRFDESIPRESVSRQLGASLTVVRSSRPLRLLLVMDILWKAASYLSTPYFGTYLLGELGFSLTFTSAMTIVYSLVRSLVSPWFGRFADRRGNAAALTLGTALTGAAYLLNIFTRPGAGRYCYIVYYVLGAVAMAGINAPLFNITYDYIDDRAFTAAMGARNAISGVAGFLASLLGGAIVSTIQAGGNRLFGMTVYAQQALSAVSGVMALGVALYLRLVIFRMPKLKN